MIELQFRAHCSSSQRSFRQDELIDLALLSERYAVEIFFDDPPFSPSMRQLHYYVYIINALKRQRDSGATIVTISI